MTAARRGPSWGWPHGLSALKNLLEVGVEADGFERDTDLGGNWNFHAENSRVYESTHLISTKPFTQFPDFPMPDSYPTTRRIGRCIATSAPTPSTSDCSITCTSFRGRARGAYG